MVPVQVPIIDYDNPFYCPSPFQVRSHRTGVKVSYSGVELPLSGKSTATLVYNHEGARNHCSDMGTSTPSSHTLVYGRKRLTHNDLSKRPVVVRKSARAACDSSPCARFLSSLQEKGPARKCARYSGSEKEIKSSGVPGGEPKEPCIIKQEYFSPTFAAFSQKEERIHEVLKDVYEKIPEDIVTTRTLLLRLDEIFPRIGFGEAADTVQNVWSEINAEYRSERHQALVDLLAKRGALNEYVLTALYDAEFCHLDLGPTMSGVNDLDLPRGDVMRVFSQPGWFERLRTLSLAGGRFPDDFALAHLRSLFQIETLVLSNTNIGNEGVFHIVALKHRLRHLDLSGNLSINDDSIPALILLKNLEFLSVYGTGILMPGLRKLAVALKEGERAIDVKIPSTCKDYIDCVHKQYLLHIPPPLISDPGTTSMLSKAALARNLAAHASVNSSIISTGTRREMEERLKGILEVRNHDVVVRNTLFDRAGQLEDS